MRERRSTHASDPDDVDVEDATPLLVSVGSDVSGGANTGIIDDDIERSKVLHHVGDGRVNLRRIGDVTDDAVHVSWYSVEGTIEYGDARTSLDEKLRRGGADAARTPRDDRD
jgi:hypothetical protein